MFIMVRRNHMLLAVSVVSVGLNFLFFHYFSTISSLADQSAGSDCSVLLGSANDKHLPSLDRRDLEKLIQMQISSGDTEKHVDIPRLSKLVDHYIKQKLIFVLGSMSSGTTLMRLVLDTHPEINCGDETKIIELMLSFIEKTNGNEYFMKFMANTGIQNSTLEKATALFIYYVMENNFKTMNLTFLKNVKYLCNKEPMNTYYFPYLHRIFPRARFLYVIRDGRDMTYSYMRRNRLPMVFREFFQHISNWNRANTIGLDRCSKMGPEYCLMVKYESLVNEPETTINAITKFLGVDFVEDMLHHDDFLKSEKLSLTKVGFINKGVQRDKINNGSIGRYKNKIEGYDEDRIANDVSLLKKLSYI